MHPVIPALMNTIILVLVPWLMTPQLSTWEHTPFGTRDTYQIAILFLTFYIFTRRSIVRTVYNCSQLYDETSIRICSLLSACLTWAFSTYLDSDSLSIFNIYHDFMIFTARCLDISIIRACIVGYLCYVTLQTLNDVHIRHTIYTHVARDNLPVIPIDPTLWDYTLKCYVNYNFYVVCANAFYKPGTPVSYMAIKTFERYCPVRFEEHNDKRGCVLKIHVQFDKYSIDHIVDITPVDYVRVTTYSDHQYMIIKDVRVAQVRLKDGPKIHIALADDEHENILRTKIDKGWPM